MKTQNDLSALLHRIDGRGYKAYKELKGAYRFSFFTLFVDHVQGDPFAAPSKIRLRVPMAVAQIPPEYYRHPHRRLGCTDFLIRSLREQIRRMVNVSRGTGKSGLITIDAGGQEILPRTALILNEHFVEARMEIGLPARGRTVLGREARVMFNENLPQIIRQGLLWEHLNQSALRTFAHYTENYFALQAQLKEHGLIAFVADGAILPRESGISQKPMPPTIAVPFRSPSSLRVELNLPNSVNGQSKIRGMGIPRGITLIVGGGFHGKSTLLRALERGIYPHIPGDGREYVVTDASAVKIRAEDGRRIEKTDIRPFINHLPRQKDALAFCSDDASGSTSQAANIIEALEAGARVLLIDEDTSATNFMIRDARMQALVHKEFEPITPLIDRIQEMYEHFGVSTVLVMGGSGDYFSVADTVILLREYEPFEVTEQAKGIAQNVKISRKTEREFEWQNITERIPLPGRFDASKGKREVKIEARGLYNIQFGIHSIDLHAVEQLVDTSQTRAIGYLLYLMATRWMDGQRSVSELLLFCKEFLRNNGPDALNPVRRTDEHPGNFALPRTFEIAAALNRYRNLRVKQKQIQNKEGTEK